MNCFYKGEMFIRLMQIKTFCKKSGITVPLSRVVGGCRAYSFRLMAYRFLFYKQKFQLYRKWAVMLKLKPTSHHPLFSYGTQSHRGRYLVRVLPDRICSTQCKLHGSNLWIIIHNLLQWDDKISALTAIQYTYCSEVMHC